MVAAELFAEVELLLCNASWAMPLGARDFVWTLRRLLCQRLLDRAIGVSRQTNISELRHLSNVVLIGLFCVSGLDFGGLLERLHTNQFFKGMSGVIAFEL